MAPVHAVVALAGLVGVGVAQFTQDLGTCPADFVTERAFNRDRDACIDACNADGYCCGTIKDHPAAHWTQPGLVGGCKKVPCAGGCVLAWYAETYEACVAECTTHNAHIGCERNHEASGLTMHACSGSGMCGCPDASMQGGPTCGSDTGVTCPDTAWGSDTGGGLRNDCSDQACQAGCAIARDLPNTAFFGRDLSSDEQVARAATLSTNEATLVSTIDALQAAVTSPGELQWKQTTCTGTQSSDSDEDGSRDCASIAGFLATSAAQDCPAADGCVFTNAADDLEQLVTDFKTHANLLKYKDELITKALDLVDAFDSSANGPLFTGSTQENPSGGYFSRKGYFSCNLAWEPEPQPWGLRICHSGAWDGGRRANGDGKEKHRAMWAVMQTIMDEVYNAGHVSRGHDAGIVHSCSSAVFQGRKWATADIYPGGISAVANPELIHTRSIDADQPADWGIHLCFWDEHKRKPTGLYLVAGELATVTVPEGMVNAGFEVLIGAHTVDNSNKDEHRRLDRVTTRFSIVDTDTTIVNPLGGQIYLMVPYLATAGIVEISIRGGVVESPLFQRTTRGGAMNTNVDWATERTKPGLFADFETDKFLLTVPRGWITAYENPVQLLTDYDTAMDAVMEFSAIPIANRVGSGQKHVLALQPDLHIEHAAFGVGYPQTNTVYNIGEVDGNTDHWLLKQGEGVEGGTSNRVCYHELGHCTVGMFPFYRGEHESIVNYLITYIRHVKFQDTFNVAWKKGLHDNPDAPGAATPDEAAVLWMITPNFRAGNDMDHSNTELDEFRYQYRGYGKYADITRMYGWAAFQDFYAAEQAHFNNGGVDANGYICCWDDAFDEDPGPWSVRHGRRTDTCTHAKQDESEATCAWAVHNPENCRDENGEMQGDDSHPNRVLCERARLDDCADANNLEDHCETLPDDLCAPLVSVHACSSDRLSECNTATLTTTHHAECTNGATDSRTLRLSIAAGEDLTPLMEFWGITAENGPALAREMNETHSLAPSLGVKCLLERYRSLIPADNRAFNQFYEKLYPGRTIEEEDARFGKGWFNVWRDAYDANEAAAARARVDRLLARFYPAGTFAESSCAGVITGSPNDPDVPRSGRIRTYGRAAGNRIGDQAPQVVTTSLVVQGAITPAALTEAFAAEIDGIEASDIIFTSYEMTLDSSMAMSTDKCPLDSSQAQILAGIKAALTQPWPADPVEDVSITSIAGCGRRRLEDGGADQAEVAYTVKSTDPVVAATIAVEMSNAASFTTSLLNSINEQPGDFALDVQELSVSAPNVTTAVTFEVALAVDAPITSVTSVVADAGALVVLMDSARVPGTAAITEEPTLVAPSSDGEDTVVLLTEKSSAAPMKCSLSSPWLQLVCMAVLVLHRF